ncbi:MAG TPA: hypothetical protein VI168_03465 [Croceibacterium sp.]
MREVLLEHPEGLLAADHRRARLAAAQQELNRIRGSRSGGFEPVRPLERFLLALRALAASLARPQIAEPLGFDHLCQT